MGRLSDLKIGLLSGIICRLPRRHFDVEVPDSQDGYADISIHMSPLARRLIMAMCRAQRVTLDDYFRQAWGLPPASPWSRRLDRTGRISDP